jgi:CPA1 family monovalent cation:H+ antiporter
MATLGVALSTLVFGVGAHLMFGLPLLVALVFGSLISSTDPVAVLDVLLASNLKNARNQNRRRKPV